MGATLVSVLLMDNSLDLQKYLLHMLNVNLSLGHALL